MGLLDDLEPNLFRGVSPFQSQQAIETSAMKVAGDLNLAKALALTGNINLATGHGTCDLNWLGTAPLVDPQNP
jgi:hypothetical protein